MNKDITLNTQISECFRITPEQKIALKKLGINTAKDLLFHFPSRYQDLSTVKRIADLRNGDHATVYGKVFSIRTKRAYRKKIPMAEAVIKDSSGSIRATWFHQPYIAKLIKEGSLVKLSGTTSERQGTLYFANPEVETANELPLDTADSLFEKSKDEPYYPVYPESKGITSRWFYHHIQVVLASEVLDSLIDPIPQEILKKYSLPTLRTALVWIHAPKKEGDSIAARKRFAFQEIFFIQLERQMQRHAYAQNPSYRIEGTDDYLKTFLKRFPFKPTNAQIKSINSILDDFKKDAPMTRLLEGDVGSGKTLVAAATAYIVINTRPNGQDFGTLQVAYMAPTEILAKQHFESFIEYFKHLPINIALITGSGCKKFPSKVSPEESTKISRTQLLKWIENGEISIVIGTHSLIQKTVKFKHLAYIIIDEQHRFGVMQRKKLTQKSTEENPIVPHLLSMTATPIPRTLALTIYGDLDLTLLDEMPAGRKPIFTEIVLPKNRDIIYKKMKKRIDEGRQAYVICPRIDEPDPSKLLALNVKSVKAEAKRLKKEVFPEFEIDLIHSKMKPTEKENVMQRFSGGEIDILVSTSVVEVGVNVPNSTMIIIEGAERFGLSQLHQLRGRVLRSTHQAYCYVFSDTKNKTSVERLKALTTAKDGFELSEYDLTLRGAGELSGRKQWGVSDIGMEAIKNIKMVEAARTEAQILIKNDPELKDHKEIAGNVSSRAQTHFE